MNASGQITATFTWVPDYTGEPPPDKIIVAESCTASWTAGGYGPYSGSADNALGFSATGNSSGGTSTGTRYSLQSGSSTVTVYCSPSASCSGTNSMLGASVAYRASAEPLEVILTGGIGPKEAKRFLIGQQVSASVTTGGLTADSYDWCIGGGNAFKNYSASNTTGVYTGLGVESGATSTFYFAKPDNPTVTCTVHLTVPAGAKPEGGITAAPSRSCSSEAPLPFDHEEAIGTVMLVPNANNPQGFRLLEASLTIPGDVLSGPGIIWYGRATTPAAFVPTYGDGEWGHAQLITPQISFTKNGVAYTLAPAWNGVERLDSKFLYLETAFPANGTFQVHGDSPGMDFVPGMTLATLNMSFKTYMMYKPGGGGSCYVPLRRFDWAFGASATLGANGTWSLNISPVPSVTQGPNYPAHPTWDKAWNNDPIFVP